MFVKIINIITLFIEDINEELFIIIINFILSIILFNIVIVGYINYYILTIIGYIYYYILIEYPIIIIGYIYNYILINFQIYINEYIYRKNRNQLKIMIMMNELEERKYKLTSGEYLIECNRLMKLYNKNMY